LKSDEWRKLPFEWKEPAMIFRKLGDVSLPDYDFLYFKMVAARDWDKNASGEVGCQKAPVMRVGQKILKPKKPSQRETNG
jgi:hypothetical protein